MNPRSHGFHRKKDRNAASANSACQVALDAMELLPFDKYFSSGLHCLPSRSLAPASSPQVKSNAPVSWLHT
ncbi:hypothetical protein Ahy_A06g027529 isoform D [Arachis hypogaea]|uniref:Uncharacterized protein n=1 Tax=Arachis hypogaea TaxID=3818 RepID=A0A445CNY7_ARAHY|nr:hypothetical protein Ahy_A06g027529 isoform D [Arachis hypogaea]